MKIPEIRYARTSDGVHIAYQVVGDGPLDLLYVPGYASNLQWKWELPTYVRFLERLASFSRLIAVDRRGTGLSDRFSPSELPPIEDVVNDLVAVLDEVGSERAVAFGLEDGGQSCCLLAATHPDRVQALIVYAMDPGGPPIGLGSAESDAFAEELLGRIDRSWGTREYVSWDIGISNPDRRSDEAFLAWFEANLRLSASPAAAEALIRLYYDTDIRPILPTINVPALIMHRIDDGLDPIEESRFTARAIPGATLVELAGNAHYWVTGEAEDLLDEVEEFVTGVRPSPEPERILTTILFTDIVGSTDRASELGDREWRDLLDAHHQRVRRELQRSGGREIDTAGDGFLARFDGPARAVRCAGSIIEALADLDLSIRAGVHTGEVEVTGDGVRGIAVHIGARIAAATEPSEILVSSTVRDLVAGSGLTFEDAGEHELKGVPDRWRLYRVVHE